MAFGSNTSSGPAVRAREALVVLAVLPGMLTAAPQDPLLATPVRWDTLDLDVLISRLPKIESDGNWDEDSREWVDAPATAELHSRIARGARLSDRQWVTALLGSGAIRMREKWPEDLPLGISMRTPRWLPLCKITMTPARSTGFAPVKCGTLLSGGCGSYMVSVYEFDANQELGSLPLGRHALTFDVEVERGESWFMPREDVTLVPGVLWCGKMTLSVEIVSSIDEVLLTIRNQSLDDAVAESLSIQLVGDGRGKISAVLVLRGEQPSTFETLRGVVVGVEAELWNGHELMESRQFVANVGYSDDPSDPEEGWLRGGELFETFPIVARRAATGHEGWFFRVRSTTDGILSAWHATSRWQGEFTIPVSTLWARNRQR